MSLFILNMVVNAVVPQWISLVKEGAGGQDGRIREPRHCATFFYAVDSLVA